ncbi:MAG: iron uptake transporter permease EfeU [Nocardioidaceae bacterium]
MLANLLIGLREGLEASLVVGILVAYLVKSGRRRLVRHVWIGVTVAVALSIGFGAFLTFTSRTLTFAAQETFAGTLSIVAVGFVTWMIFWMRRTARFIKAELEGKLDSAIAMGPVALVIVAFLAVGREGLETSLFIWSAAQATSGGPSPFIGATAGLLAAVVLGTLFYFGALRINLAKFFTYTGAFLVLVAAGVLAYGVHDLQEGRALPGFANKAFDVSSTLPLDSWFGSILKGAFNYNPTPTVLEMVVWVGYLVPVMIVFLWPQRRPTPPRRTPEPASAAV